MQIDTTTHRTWRDWLARFEAEASTQGFVDYINELQRLDHEVLTTTLMAPLYGHLVFTWLTNAYLLAAVQALPDQVEGALAEIRRATQNVRFDSRAPKQLKPEVRELYSPIVSHTTRELKAMGKLLFNVFTHYVRNEIEPDITADEILREACRLSLAGDDKSAIRRMGTAGAAILLGSPMWRGWQHEGSKVFREHAFLLYSALESCRHVLPLLPIAEQRQKSDEITQQIRWAPKEKEGPGSKQTASRAQTKPVDITPDQVTRLLQITEHDGPWTDAEIQSAAAEREQYIKHAKEMLLNLMPMPGPIKAQITSLAIHILGILRCDDPEVIEHLIGLIVESEESDDAEGLLDAWELTDAIVQALQWIGGPAVPACLTFLRNSFHTEARFEVARALGAAGRGSDEVFQYLLDQFEQTSPQDGKARWAMPLALTHDERAIAPLVRGLEATRDEPDEIVREYEACDYLDALDEMGAIVAFITPPDTCDAGEDIVWTTVEVRGVGLIEGVAPADWVPPAERAEEEEDWEGDDWDEGYSDIDNALDPQWSPVEFISPSPPRPSSRTVKVGRNDPCPCGSGKKYKHCCGKLQK